MSAIGFFHDFGQIHGTASRSATPKPRRGILRRIYDAIILSRQLGRANIARFLGVTDGNLTGRSSAG